MKMYTGAQMHVEANGRRGTVDLLLDENQAKSVGASIMLLNSLFEPNEFKAWVTYGYVECDESCL